jgi:uncharacterized protein (TIRG00374 family)
MPDLERDPERDPDGARDPKAGSSDASESDAAASGGGASDPASGGASSGASDDTAERRKRSIATTVRRAIAVLGTALVVEFIVLPQLAGAQKDVSTLTSIDIWLLIAAVLAEAASILAYAQLEHSVLPRETAPSLFRIAQIQLATLAVSHLVPGGSAAGSGLGVKLLTNEGVDSEDAAFAIGLQGLGSAAVLNVMLWIALIVSIPLHGYNRLYATAAIVGVVVLGAFFAIVIGLTRGEERTTDIVRAIARHVPFLSEDRSVEAVHRVADRLRSVLGDRPRLVRTIGWAAANWLLDAACLWIFLVAFGDTVNPVYLLVAYGLAYVVAAVPVTPGGLGVVEAVLTASLVGFGVPRSTAVLGVVAYRLVNFWLPIPIGGLAYASLRAGVGRRPKRRGVIKELTYRAAADREDARTWAERHGVETQRHRDDGASG